MTPGAGAPTAGATTTGPDPGTAAPAAAGAAPTGPAFTPDLGGGEEVALPSANWLFDDGAALVAPPASEGSPTRPLWVAVLIGLAAGIGLTAAAAAVVGSLNRSVAPA